MGGRRVKEGEESKGEKNKKEVNNLRVSKEVGKPQPVGGKENMVEDLHSYGRRTAQVVVHKSRYQGTYFTTKPSSLS